MPSARTFPLTARLARALGLPCGIILGTLAGCAGTDDSDRESRPATAAVTPADTGVAQTSASTPAAGVGVQVTKTDMRSVTDAARYRLTTENFARFMQASESLHVLRARDPEVRRTLDQNIVEAGSSELDAGLRMLESQPSVRAAIEAAGLSVRDYFVMSIAIASAQRFIDSPEAAPPSPVTSENAVFLRGRTADLTRLSELRG